MVIVSVFYSTEKTKTFLNIVSFMEIAINISLDNFFPQKTKKHCTMDRKKLCRQKVCWKCKRTSRTDQYCIVSLGLDGLTIMMHPKKSRKKAFVEKPNSIVEMVLGTLTSPFQFHSHKCNGQ